VERVQVVIEKVVVRIQAVMVEAVVKAKAVKAVKAAVKVERAVVAPQIYLHQCVHQPDRIFLCQDKHQ
jgi:hypothetical protein